MSFALPFIHGYSTTAQLLILFALLFLSYVNRHARGVIGILSIVVLVYKLAVPLSAWGWYAFKGIAMLGFYIKFFLVGWRYIKSTIDYFFPSFLDGLVEAWEKSGEESRQREERRRQQARFEEAMRNIWEEEIRGHDFERDEKKPETKGQGKKKEGKRRR